MISGYIISCQLISWYGKLDYSTCQVITLLFYIIHCNIILYDIIVCYITIYVVILYYIMIHVIAFDYVILWCDIL